MNRAGTIPAEVRQGIRLACEFETGPDLRSVAAGDDCGSVQSLFRVMPQEMAMGANLGGTSVMGFHRGANQPGRPDRAGCAFARTTSKAREQAA